MLEAGANQMPEAELIEAIEYGEKICQQLNDLQKQIIAEMAQPKMAWSKPEEDHSLEDRIREHLKDRGQEMLDAVQGEGFRGIDEMGKRVYAELSATDATIDEKAVRAATEVVLKAYVRGRVLNDDVRADGRTSTQIRPISEIGRAHV